MKIICFASAKGGVGKTSSTQNVGYWFGRQGYKTLLLDADPQASLTRSFGVPLDKVRGTLYDLLEGDNPEQLILSDVVDLLPATPELFRQAREIQSARFHEFKLAKALNKVDYDYIFIDCPPALDVFTTMALVACDYYYVPLQAEFLAYEGLANFINYINLEIGEVTEGCQLGGVFPTRYNPKIRTQLRNQMLALAKHQLGEYYFEDCYIRENVAISEAQALGTSVFNHKPESNGASDYERLAKRILEQIK